MAVLKLNIIGDNIVFQLVANCHKDLSQLFAMATILLIYFSWYLY